MRIAVPAETQGAETRVAATPETVKKFMALGAEVVVQTGAGLDVRHPRRGVRGGRRDDREAGRRGAARGADIVLKVRRPGEGEIAGLPAGALVVAIMDPYGNEAALEALAKANVAAFAMEFMPRITRAQVDGRAVLAGQSRRLPRGDRRAPPNTAAPCR